MVMKKFSHIWTKDVTAFFVRRFSSFTYLNITQFLGALNDNIYKLLIVYFFIQLEGIEKSPIILAETGALFVLPFLLFSASSGTLADRFSKRNIIVWTKVLELVITVSGVIAFIFESKAGSYMVLFLLATQSAIFGPSKYGIVPELVEENKITKANGLLTSFTFLAIIIGTFSASFLLDITDKNFLFAAVFCAILSVVGLITSLCIEYTPPSGFHKRFNVFFLAEIYQTLKMAYQVPSLLATIFGSAFFLFLGAYVQLNMIPFAVNVLGLTDIQGGYLFLMTAVGIGAGSLLAGKISGKSVELGLVPLAGIGIMFSCYAVDFFSMHLWVVVPLILFQGMLGGIYEVPLDSYVQIASPHQYRGQVVAATNFFSYLGVLCASLLLYVNSELFDYPADKGFTVIGMITLMTTIVLLFQFFDYVSRFVGMILSRLHFETEIEGSEKIPTTPAIYICNHTAWNDTLLMLGAQRRRMRFFIEEEQEHRPWMKKLYKMLRAVNIPEPLNQSQECFEEISSCLKRGISVCIFLHEIDVHREFKKICNSPTMRKITQELQAPLVPVVIEKGAKEKEPLFFKGLMHKLHVPARLSFGMH